MDSIIVYLALSSAIGFIQLYETYKFTQADSVKINWAMGLIESAWFFVSCYFLWAFPLSFLEQLVAIIYIATMVSSSITLSGWFNRDPENTKNGFVVPLWYIPFSFVFEVVFIGLSVSAMFYHKVGSNALSFSEYLSAHFTFISLFFFGILLIGFLFWLFSYKGLQWLKDDVSVAISTHEICNDVFGVVKHIELDQEVTDEYEEEDVFAYFVTGEKSSGLLVAEIITNMNSDEEIIQGYIELDDGEIIEIDEPERKEF